MHGCIHSLVLYDPKETSEEVRTAAGLLAGYAGRTWEAYTLDLRKFYRWCFEVTRTHIELYARELEELVRAPATIGRRLSTLAGFYRFATEEGVIEHSPAVHVRRPKLDHESHAVGLDRNELGAFLVQAGLFSPRDHALCSLLALNGLRISEALGADIDQLGLERGHRTLVVHRKGGKTVTIPLAPRTARAST
jgi:site-specific recombinase XerD